MKVLLDEDLPHRLRLYISGHEVQTAVYAGFTGLKNGRLLEALVQAGFEVLVTGDKNIPHQQHLALRPFGTVVLSSQLLPVLKTCLPALQAAIDNARSGSLAYLDCIGTES